MADNISRDTASANNGALKQEFNDAKRTEFEQGLAAMQILGAELQTGFERKARLEKEKKARRKRRTFLNILNCIIEKSMAQKKMQLMMLGDGSVGKTSMIT